MYRILAVICLMVLVGCQAQLTEDGDILLTPLPAGEEGAIVQPAAAISMADVYFGWRAEMDLRRNDPDTPFEEAQLLNAKAVAIDGAINGLAGNVMRILNPPVGTVSTVDPPSDPVVVERTGTQ